MTKKTLVLILVLIIGLSLTIFLFKSKRKSPQVNKEVEEKTEVIRYKQTYIPKESKTGNCWTTSIAAASNDRAWRCSVGDFIFDPCFETETNQVVCDVNPETPEGGFVLKLTKNLPQQQKGIFNQEEIKKWPWIVKLQNGLTCYIGTGTADYIDGEFSYFMCDKDKAMIVGDLDKSGPIWKADIAYPSEETGKSKKREIVNIIKVWE